MVIGAWGVAGVGVGQLVAMFQRLGTSCAVVHNNQLHRIKVDVFKEPIAVIFSSVKAFLRFHDRISKKIVAFILDSPIELTFMSLPILGAYSIGNHLFKFSSFQDSDLKSAYENFQPLDEISYKPKAILQQIVKSYKDSSVLAPIQTFLYTIKDVGVRGKINLLIKDWLCGNTNLEKVTVKIHKHLKTAQANKLVDLLSGDKFKNLRKAATEMKKDPSRAKTLASKYKVAMYDLKYLVH